MFPAVGTDQGEGGEGPNPAGSAQGRHREGGGRPHSRPSRPGRSAGPGAPRPRPRDDHCLELRPTEGTLSAGKTLQTIYLSGF